MICSNSSKLCRILLNFLVLAVNCAVFCVVFVIVLAIICAVNLHLPLDSQDPVGLDE